MLRISVRREAHRAHRLDVNVESPTGTSCSDPHGAHVLLEVHADSPTSNLKLKLADIWPEFASEATVLVHCGRVLGDWKPLADYVVQGGTVWWLRSCRGRSPVWSDSLAGSDAESLRSLFPINGLAPSQAQQPNLPSNLCRVVTACVIDQDNPVDDVEWVMCVGAGHYKNGNDRIFLGPLVWSEAHTVDG